VTIEPLRLSFEIACPRDHAFEVWTTRMGAWWPKGHSTSGDPRTVVTLEPRLGGRIYERTSDDRRIDWGEITAWDPPRSLTYLWHIGREASQATVVELSFVDNGDETTRLDIVHSGWEQLGAEAVEYRNANTNGWQTLLPSFVRAAEAPRGDVRL
jgi:hypothetical protein